MKTVKFYNKTTGRWEPIAGISTLGGVSDYNDLSNKPDLSVYALKSELEALREELTNLINSQEPNSQYYTEYTIDNSASTFSLRSVDNPINNGQYIPQFSGGYDYIKLTLTNGNVTTNLNTSASEVEKIRIYYPAGTTYVKFTDTKVKDVEYIECSNFTDATSMFKNCLSLESANLSTLDSSKVQVDNTMFMGVNTNVQLQFNDQWSYTNRDMGLIKMINVDAYLYREDGLYDFSRMYISSQYGELYNGLLFSHTDPTDERWRFEPLELEAGVTYSCYIGFEGVYGDTFELNFSEDAEIYFVGVTPNSFTEIRPEIGGNEEPEEDYITGFSLDTSEFYMYNIGEYYQVQIYPNEEGRPMNFVVDLPNSSWSVLSYDYASDSNTINFILNSACMPMSGSVTVRETYSGTTQELYIFVQPKVTLTVHYKDVNGDISGDYLSIEGVSDFYFNAWGTDFSFDLAAYTSHTLIIYAGYGQMHLGQINLSGNTEIWISEDSSEIMYEEPAPEPSEPEVPEGNPYYMTYTIAYEDGSEPVNTSWQDTDTDATAYRYLPVLEDNNTHEKFEPEKIEITTNDGQITDDLSTRVDNVKQIKVYYTDKVTRATFSSGYDGTNSNTCMLKELLAINTSNFTSTRIMFYGNEKLVSICHMDMGKVLYADRMFDGCSSLTSLDLNDWDTSSLVGTDSMFYNCTGLQTLSISKWNTSKIKDMDYMFTGCSSLTSLDLNDWNTSSLVNMSGIFRKCTNATEINVSNWNITGVTELSSIFAGCNSLRTLDLSKWDVANVKYLSGTFDGCNSLEVLNLSTWNTRLLKETSSIPGLLALRGVPSTVDFCYDGNNYTNWTLTEAETEFSGTFPWTESRSKYISGFNVEPTEISTTTDGTDVIISITPFEQGKEVNFSAETIGFGPAQMFNTTDYDNGESEKISLIIWNFSGTTSRDCKVIITEQNSGCQKTIPVVFTDIPEPDFVDFTVHFKDIRNAYDEIYIEWNEPEYRSTTYSLSDAQTDDYGKYIVVQVSKDKDNYFTFRDTTGAYNPYNSGFGLTGATSLWFDFGANQYNLNTPTDANISGDEVSLTVNYIPMGDQVLSSITVQDGAYTRSIPANYNSDNNEYYVQLNVLVGPETQIETIGVWHSFYASKSKEIWLLPYDSAIYETRPAEIPSYTEFNPIIHLYVPDDSYELGYTYYMSFPGSGYALEFDGAKDEFGLYGTVQEYSPMYTGVQYDIQFYDRTNYTYESFYRRVVFTEPVAELWFILNDENVYYEQPTITEE